MVRWFAGVAGAGVLAIVIAGCGTTATSVHGDGSQLPHSEVVAARAAVEAAAAEPGFTLASAPRFNARVAAGRTIWVVNSSSTDSFATAIQIGIQQAAGKAGLSVRVVDGQGSAEVQDQGVLTAVGAHAAAIIVDAAALQVLSTGLSAAAGAGIPVIDVAVSVPHGPHPNGDYQHVAVPYASTGRLMAQYVVANLAKSGHLLELTDNEYSSVAARDGAAAAEFGAGCPKCGLIQYSIPFATLGSSAPSTIETLLHRYPSVGWVFSAYDAQAVDAIAAVKGVGAAGRVRVVSADGSPANLRSVQSGGVEVADVGEPAYWMGWAAVDAALRAMLHLPKVTEAIPVRLFDRKDLAGVNVNSQTSLFGNAYIAGYMRLWELS
ncbi:MAG: sugar ABC transporter substrate-binding protein [Candidatus Dormibacteria bacterium]